MTIGTKIKEYRTKLGFTQKDLAEKLHVTYQAVSRWENGDVEPSIDTIKELTTIFDCTLDDLFGIEKAPAPAPEIQVVEKVVVKDAKPILALCEECNKPICEKDEIFRIEKQIGSGRSATTHKQVLCKDCFGKWSVEEAKKKETAKRERIEGEKTRRKRSFVWPSVIAAILIAVGVGGFAMRNTNLGIVGVVVGVLSYPFVASMFLDNTFLPDMWLEIASWGFVKMPGVIMEFSLGGLLIGFALKILLWVIGFLIAIGAVLLATGLGMVLSVVVYPIALRRSFRATGDLAGQE